MTTDTSTADKRGVEYMYIDYSTWLSRPILVGDKPKPHEVEYVRHDELKAMEARAEKAEAVLGLKDALVQEERRVRIRAETARDGLRHEVEDLQAENERLRHELGMIAFSDFDAVEARAHALATIERKEGADV